MMLFQRIVLAALCFLQSGALANDFYSPIDIESFKCHDESLLNPELAWNPIHDRVLVKSINFKRSFFPFRKTLQHRWVQLADSAPADACFDMSKEDFERSGCIIYSHHFPFLNDFFGNCLNEAPDPATSNIKHFDEYTAKPKIYASAEEKAMIINQTRKSRMMQVLSFCAISTREKDTEAFLKCLGGKTDKEDGYSYFDKKCLVGYGEFEKKSNLRKAAFCLPAMLNEVGNQGHGIRSHLLQWHNEGRVSRVDITRISNRLIEVSPACARLAVDDIKIMSLNTYANEKMSYLRSVTKMELRYFYSYNYLCKTPGQKMICKQFPYCFEKALKVVAKKYPECEVRETKPNWMGIGSRFRFNYN